MGQGRKKSKTLQYLQRYLQLSNMEKTTFMAPAAPTRQGCSSTPWFQLKAPIINQYSWAQQLTGNITSSSEPHFLQALN